MGVFGRPRPVKVSCSGGAGPRAPADVHDQGLGAGCGREDQHAGHLVAGFHGKPEFQLTESQLVEVVDGLGAVVEAPIRVRSSQSGGHAGCAVGSWRSRASLRAGR